MFPLAQGVTELAIPVQLLISDIVISNLNSWDTLSNSKNRI